MININSLKNNIIKSKGVIFWYLSEVFSHFYFKIFILACFGINFLLWVFTLLVKNSIKGDLVVLHYNINFGVDLVGKPSKLFVIPIFGLIVVFLNSLLSIVFVKFSGFKFVSQILLGVAIAVNIFLILALYFIYIINF